MSSILQYQVLFLRLYLLQDKVCPLIKEGCSKCIGIPGQTPAKTLIIQFYLHLSINKQWLAGFKILYFSSTFTNVTIPLMKSILWNVWFSEMFSKIVFHRRSNYDYHFIIKELTNEFEGRFECIGENRLLELSSPQLPALISGHRFPVLTKFSSSLASS